MKERIVKELEAARFAEGDEINATVYTILTALNLDYMPAPAREKTNFKACRHIFDTGVYWAESEDGELIQDLHSAWSDGGWDCFTKDANEKLMLTEPAITCLAHFARERTKAPRNWPLTHIFT